MTNVNFTNRKLVAAISGDFMAQPAFDTPIATADIDYRQAMTTPAFHANQMFREEQRDCGGGRVVIEYVTGKIAKFTFAFNFNAKLGAGYYALLRGIAAAPTGTPANEIQTLAFGGATAGSYKLAMDFEGLQGTTSAIAFDATNSVIQAAIQAIRPIKSGNLVVTGTTSKTLTFGGRLANANLPLFTVVDDTTTGGTGVTISAGTNGANKLHAISEIATDRPPLFSIIEGFQGDTGGTKRYKNMVMNDWTVNATRGGIVGLTVTAFGDPEGEVLSGYTMPACVTPAPVRAGDCRYMLGADWITGDLREFTYTESNNIDVSADAIKFDDITPDQLEAGDRTATLNLLTLGSPTSAMYQFAEDEDTAFAAGLLALGRPGERLTLYHPNAQYRLDDGLIEFAGGKNRSAFRLLGRPSPDVSDIVTRGELMSAFTGTFLLTS